MTETLDHRFPCEACGADLRFTPSVGQLVCDHCGNTEPMEGRRVATLAEIALSDGLRGEGAAEMEETRVSTCPNCAAQVEFDPDIHAAECPYCATPVVTDTGAHRHIKPAGVLPFALEEAQAHEAMSQWLGSLWFAPNGLKEYARKGRRMQGVYVPYWTFDADTTTDYRGQRGTVYYQTVTVIREGKPVRRKVPRVRWRAVSGQVRRAFDDVLVLASRALPADDTRALAPWDLAGLTPYTPEYLAGFRAEGYTVSLEEGFEDAKYQMDAVINRDIRFDIGGDKQKIDHAKTQMRDVTFKHVLLPVWLAAYRYRGQSFRFVVNGQTGRVQGERPYSKWKIGFAVLAGLLVAAGIGYAIAVSEQGGF